MSSIIRGLKYLIYKRAYFVDSIVRRFFTFLPDKSYLSLRFRCRMGYWIDWNNPKTFSEKLQWLKVYDREPELTKMVDKLAVKDYVAKRIGSEHIIPTLGVWNVVNEIEWEKLPERFVLKTTHGGGGNGVVICRDKSTFDRQEAVGKLSASMKADLFSAYREWPYKNVVRRIIAEKYMVDESGEELKDYKFFCFNGVPKYVKVDFDRFIEHHANYYDMDWNLQEFGETDLMPVPGKHFEKPENFEQMKVFASKLSANIPFLRVDLYNINGKIYFGELTFYPASGMGTFSPSEWDLKLGQMIKLP